MRQRYSTLHCGPRTPARHRRKRNGSARSAAIQTNGWSACGGVRAKCGRAREYAGRMSCVCEVELYNPEPTEAQSRFASPRTPRFRLSSYPGRPYFSFLKTSQRRTKIEVVGTRSHTPPGTSERVPACTPSTHASTSLLSRLPRLRERFAFFRVLESLRRGAEPLMAYFDCLWPYYDCL